MSSSSHTLKHKSKVLVTGANSRTTSLPPERDQLVCSQRSHAGWTWSHRNVRSSTGLTHRSGHSLCLQLQRLNFRSGHPTSFHLHRKLLRPVSPVPPSIWLWAWRCAQKTSRRISASISKATSVGLSPGTDEMPRSSNFPRGSLSFVTIVTIKKPIYAY